jgi:hypothetical protein
MKYGLSWDAGQATDATCHTEATNAESQQRYPYVVCWKHRLTQSSSQSIWQAVHLHEPLQPKPRLAQHLKVTQGSAA